jgi:1-phosphatidylinositol-4-phosphate 5-kinase
MNDGGRSGSFFFWTFDQSVIIKTVTADEKRVLLNVLLPEYLKRLEGGDSALVRVLGMYMLCINHYSINVMLMQNVLLPTRPHAKFDIKGSRFQRQVMSPSAVTLPRPTMKDLDFFATHKSLSLSEEDAQVLMRRLTGDVKMLAGLGLMDYSLLVAVYSQSDEVSFDSPYFYCNCSCVGLSYRIALIDIMQAYNFAKRAENCLKQVVYRVPQIELSSVSPEMYAVRFLKVIRSALNSL